MLTFIIIFQLYSVQQFSNTIQVLKYIQQKSMQQLPSRLTIIKKLSQKIRQIQIQNGYSVQQIDQYLTEVLQEHLESMQAYQKNSADNKRNANTQIQILEKTIKCLQIQICHLTKTETVPKTIESKVEEMQPFSPVAVIKKQPQQLQIQFNPQEQDQQLDEYKTPKLEYYGDVDWIKESGYSFLQQDIIEKSIQETIQRTRKLREYLNEKMKKEKMKKLEFSVNMKIFQEAYVD